MIAYWLNRSYRQGVPHKHMASIVRAHCLPELSEEAPTRSVHTTSNLFFTPQ